MANSAELAAKWTKFVAARPEFPAGPRLLAQFTAGRITRLCDCGCNSFDFASAEDPNISTLVQPSGGFGSVFELEFRTNEEVGSLEFCVFADDAGRFAGIDVSYCANSYPVPPNVEVTEPPYHVRVSERFDA